MWVSDNLIKDYQIANKYTPNNLDSIDLHQHAIEKTPWSKVTNTCKRKKKKKQKTYLFTCSTTFNK